MATSKTPKASKFTKSRKDYKHRETITFKGLTYRYDKSHTEWRLVEKHPAVNVPRVIFGRGPDDAPLWGAGSLSGEAKTPVQALQAWLASVVDLRSREAARAELSARDLRAEVKHLKSKTWTS